MWLRNQYEEFDAPKKYPADHPANDLSSPESIQSVERAPLRYIDRYLKPEIPGFTKRFSVAFLCCMGFIIMFGMRTIMGIVKLEIKSDIASVDSAIFWGYSITQIPGGFLAAKYPANKLFGAAIGFSAFLNLIVPLVYQYPTLLIILKVMQGLVEGVTYPACHGIMRHWAPPLERSRLATLAFSGCYAGLMFGMPISGELIKRIGPKAPFFFYGIMGIIWYLAWLWLVFEKPRYHPCIEPKELAYIENSLGEHGQVHSIPTITNAPWDSFFTSMPCYAIFIANFCRSWNFYLLVLFQASYFKDVYNADIEENAFLGALPHLVMTIVVTSGGILADHLRKKEILTTTQVRKLFNCGGFALEATFFILMAYSKSYAMGITNLTLGVAFSGFAISGFNVNHLDIAPRYASILMGLSNGIGTIAGAICPYVVTWLKGENPTAASWRRVFILSACIHYAGVTFYYIFASGELQPWADPKLEEEKQWNQMNEQYSVRKKSSTTSNGLLQRQLSTKFNYGSVDTPLPPRPPEPTAPPPQPEQQQTIVPVTNPFLSGTNPFRQEAVQPEAQDAYMHGTIEDRAY